MKKTITLALFLLVVSLAFFSCKGVIDNSNFKTDGYILIDDEEVVPEYVIKINGNSISFAEYRYYFLNEKGDLDGGDESIWTKYPEYFELPKQYAEEDLLEVYSIRTLAKENGVEPDYEQVAEEIKEYKGTMTTEEFNEGLAMYNLTDELYEYILQGYDLYVSLFDYYFGEDGVRAMTDSEMTAYIEENYTHAKHILIYPNTTMSDSDYESYLNTVLYEARSTDSFDAVVAKYSDDDKMPSYGYYFTDGEMPEEFVLACNELEEGEISGLVKSSLGYHVIQKLPVDTSDLSELKNVVYNHIYDEIIEDKIASAEIEYSSVYEAITPTNVK